jgi:hypothetical protein
VDVYCELRRGEQSKFCKALDGKQLSSVLYGMHPVTLNELKVSVQEGQNGAVNKTSVDSMVQSSHIATDSQSVSNSWC